jgi:hypothetical protein
MNLRGRLSRLERRVPSGNAPARLSDVELAERGRLLFEMASRPGAPADVVDRANQLKELLWSVRQRLEAEGNWPPRRVRPQP